LLVEKKSDGTTYNYLYAGGRLYARKSNNGTVYYHQDGLGSTVAITNSTGAVLNEYTYDVFGEPHIIKETVENSILFTGEPYDQSGLVYLRARYYDPTTGRFISKDTYKGEITDPSSQNSYAYCGNNPVNAVDPSGHWEYKTDEGYNVYAIAEEGDTLSGLAEELYGDPEAWVKFEFSRDPQTLQVGERIQVAENGCSINPHYGLNEAEGGEDYNDKETWRYTENELMSFAMGISRFHTDYNLHGEKFLHDIETGFRYNNKGQLVEHSGKVIGKSVGKAAKVLKYLKEIKPGFFTKMRTPIPFIFIPKDMIYGLTNNVT